MAYYPLLFFLFCFYLPLGQAQSQSTLNIEAPSALRPEGKVLMADYALYKIGNKDVLFYSDVGEQLADLEMYHCIYPDGAIFFFLNIDKDFFQKFKRIDRAIKQKSEQLDHVGMQKQLNDELLKVAVEHVLFLKKIYEHIKSQRIQLDRNLLSLLEQSAKSNRCLSQSIHPKKGFNRLEDLAKQEVFLRSRFNQETFWISKDEIEQYKKNHPQIKDDKQIGHLLKAEKVRRAFGIFRESLNRQIVSEMI